MLNANFGYQIQMTVNLTVEMLPTEKSSIRDNGLQAPLMIEWGVGGRDGRRGCLRPRRAGAAHELAPDPFPRGARAQCRAACRGRARPAGETRRTRGRTRARRAGAHGLGAPAQARVRARSPTLPAVCGRHEDHRRQRRACGDCQDLLASGIACRRTAALLGTAAGALRGSLRFKTRRRAYDPARPALAYGSRSASKSVTSGRRRGRQSRRSGKFSPNSARLTASCLGETVIREEKGGLNCLYFPASIE